MICLSVLSKTAEAMEASTRRLGPLVDAVEYRLDLLEGPERFSALVESTTRPVVLTCRSRDEGGRYQGPERERIKVLEKALQARPAFLDLELSLPRSVLKGFIAGKGASRIILSVHFMDGSPAPRVLKSTLEKARALGPDVVKIVTYATCWDEVLSTLGLILSGRRQGLNVAAFCMGPLGKISRLVSYMMGGFITYVSTDGRSRLAPGQLTIREMKGMLRWLK